MTSCEVEGPMGPALVESRAHDLQLRCLPEAPRIPALSQALRGQTWTPRKVSA